jgi:uncharacterized protein YwbE
MSNLKVARGVLKALFTTSPTKATDVRVEDGKVVVRPAADSPREH